MTSVTRLPVLALAILLAGCGSSNSNSNSGGNSGGTAPSGQLASGGATTGYVIQGGTSYSILEFSATATGSVSPTATLLLPSSFEATAVAVDSSGQTYVGGQLLIYVAGQLSPASPIEILVYPAGATGAATPTRTIIQNLCCIPIAMTVDSSGSLYVAGSGAVAVYPSTANGSATPTALIQGSATGLNSDNDIAVDSSGNIYVTNYFPQYYIITVFAAGATGNVAPVRTITLPSSSIVTGLAVDSSGDLYTIENQLPTNGPFSTGASIVEFAPGASGAATPIKTITASALTDGFGLSRDSAGNLYLVNETATGVFPNVSVVDSVLGFGPTASGTVTPGINLTSTAWNLAGGQMAIK
jgi:hypothetical protein